MFARESGPFPIVDKSKKQLNNFGFINANRKARENLGYSMSELAGLTPLDVKKKLDRAEFESIVNPLREGRVEKFEYGAFSQICEIAQPSGVVELDRVLQALHERHEVDGMSAACCISPIIL